MDIFRLVILKELTSPASYCPLRLDQIKVIFTKDIFILLKLLGLDAFKDVPYSLLEQNHEYYYFSDFHFWPPWLFL